MRRWSVRGTRLREGPVGCEIEQCCFMVVAASEEEATERARKRAHGWFESPFARPPFEDMAAKEFAS